MKPFSRRKFIYETGILALSPVVLFDPDILANLCPVLSDGEIRSLTDPQITTLGAGGSGVFSEQGLSDTGSFIQNTFSGGTSTGINNCFTYTSPTIVKQFGFKGSLQEIQIVSGNGTTTVPWASGITHYTSVLEYVSGTIQVINWLNNGAGADLGSLAAGGFYDTGLNAVTLNSENGIPASTIFWHRTFLGGLTAAIPTLRRTCQGALSESSANSNGATDNTQAGTHPSASSGNGCVPDVLYTTPTRQTKSYLFLGDSITCGFNCHDETIGGASGVIATGWAGYAFGNQTVTNGLTGNFSGLARPYRRWAAGGRQLTNVVNSTAPVYDFNALCKGFNNVWICLGRNDLSNNLGNRSAAQIIADLVTLINGLGAAGCPNISVATITPYCSSTDNFLTTTNQTVIQDTNGVRQTVNTAIRNNTIGANFSWSLVDIAAIVEFGGAGSPSGFWNASGSATYSGAVTSDVNAAQFSDTSASFSTAANRYQFVRWKTSANGNAGLAAEVLTVNSSTQITCGTNMPHAIAIGDTYDVYTRWCWIDNGSATPDQGEHLSTYGYAKVAQTLVNTGIY